MKYTLFLALFSLLGCGSTQLTNKDNPQKEVPKITKPILKKIWVPEEIKNNGTEYVEGHYMNVIEKDSVWSQ